MEQVEEEDEDEKTKKEGKKRGHKNKKILKKEFQRKKIWRREREIYMCEYGD